MGRRFCPSDRVVSKRRAIRATRLLIVFCIVAGPVSLRQAAAQTASDGLANRPAAQTEQAKAQTDKMVVEAAELRYDTTKNTVSAEGNAQVYYKGRILEADRVVYDRNTKRVFAKGHARLTERDGTIIHAERFDLTDDFRDGFIESVRADTPQKTHFSSPHTERIEEETTVFDKGTYSACDPNADPDKPPLWWVRAKRIIHKNDEQMIYYENAWLEFLGVPVVYVPFFSTPDPTVKRKSGILEPHYVTKTSLGTGVGIPIYWTFDPSYDLTVTPTVYTKQGFFGSAEWRQRFENGSYYIRANGIDETNPTAFPIGPWGAADQHLRGDLESKGQLAIADQWKAGWEFTLLSDKWFLNDYQVSSQTLSSNFISESTSTVYLTGQGGRGYFDLRGYQFEGLSNHDFQPEQPLVHPVWDYNKTFDVDPAQTYGLGGQVELDFNLTSLSAPAASFQSVGTHTLDNAYNLYDVCINYVPGNTAGTCLVRGIGGYYTRATLDPSWKRKFIDPIGEVWTPFAFAHLNGEWLDLNTTNTYTFASSSGASTFTNASQLNFFNDKQSAFYGEVIPGAGLEYRYPFFAQTGFGSVTLEPIGQIIVRPNSQLGSNSLVNLDAQSLVFDDSTLFDWSKYSGYDRFETGTRLNYGGQITANFNNGGYANLIAGQSYQLAGVNSYATPDAANVGLSSGLDTRLSDYVGSFTIAPSSALAFTAKGRFDVDTFAPRRIDLVTNYNLGAWTGAIQYANYFQQPVIGYAVRREGLALNSRYQFTENLFAQGNITFDMSRHLYPASVIGVSTPGAFFPASIGVGAGFQDVCHCASFSVNYKSFYMDNGSGSLQHNQTVLFSLQLRTLGEAKFTQTFNEYSTIDGMKY